MGMKLLKRLNIVLIGMLTVLFTLAFCAKGVNAAEGNGRDVSDHITSIEITNSETRNAEKKYNDGARLTVKGLFDDAKGKIKANDYINISWPADPSKQAYATGFNGTKDLTIDGLNVGSYTVTTSGQGSLLTRILKSLIRKLTATFLLK